MKINIALGVSRDWLSYSATTVASILYNASEEDLYNFFILSDGFNSQEKNIFYSLNEIKASKFYFIEMDNSAFEGAVHDWLGVSASYRLKLSSLVDEEKILYLDSDIIALDNIKELYRYDISNFYLAAVEDKCGNIMKSRVGLNETQIFFNSGVLLLNLEMFRRDNLEKIIFETLRSSTYYTDQDAINDVCKDKILSLPLKYNIVPGGIYSGRENERDEAYAAPVLYHFAEKPWNQKCITRIDDWERFRSLIL